MLKDILKENDDLSPLQKEYREFFSELLKKFGAESPADLTDEQKIQFFDAIAKYWENGKGPKKNPEEIKIDKKEESKDEEMNLNNLIEKLKQDKLKEIEGVNENKINETPVGQKGRTSRKEAAEYIADHPEMVKEIEKMVKQVGGKEVFKQIVKIVLDVDVDQYEFKANELEHMRMKKISNLMKDYGSFIK